MAKGELITRLEEVLLECSDCPPKRNCCSNLNSSFSLPVRDPEAAFGGREEQIEMFKQGKAYFDSGGFHLTSPCPFLGQERSCSIHDQREEKGMQGCLEYPLRYSFDRPQNEDKNRHYLFIDYTCYGVEKNWNLALSLFQDLLSEDGTFPIEVERPIIEEPEIEEGGKIVISNSFLNPKEYERVEAKAGVLVRYLNREERLNKDELSTFEKLRKNGEIPPQKIPGT